jgi:hypothetical protein
MSTPTIRLRPIAMRMEAGMARPFWASRMPIRLRWFSSCLRSPGTSYLRSPQRFESPDRRAVT